MNDGGLPDILAPGLSVVFCGINPGLRAVAGGHHFIGRGNRFWRVLHLAGFTPTQLEPEQDASVIAFGLGLTAVVDRATASADEVTHAELSAGGLALRRKLAHYAPRSVAFLGKAAFAAISATRDVAWGKQPDPIAGAAVWVLPNPSGRNLSFSIEALVHMYAQLRQELG